jgi:hypothetical protein
MKASMETMVMSLVGDKMLAGAAMIGRRVAVPNGPLMLLGGQPVDAESIPGKGQEPAGSNTLRRRSAVTRQGAAADRDLR